MTATANLIRSLDAQVIRLALRWIQIIVGCLAVLLVLFFPEARPLVWGFVSGLLVGRFCNCLAAMETSRSTHPGDTFTANLFFCGCAGVGGAFMLILMGQWLIAAVYVVTLILYCSWEVIRSELEEPSGQNPEQKMGVIQTILLIPFIPLLVIGVLVAMLLALILSELMAEWEWRGVPRDHRPTDWDY